MERVAETGKQHEPSPAVAGHGKSASRSSASLPPAFELQQLAGNQAMQQLLRSGQIKAKLAISNPDDPEEREADYVASTIMRKNAGAPCSCSPGEEMCEECQQRQSGPFIQRRAPSPAARAHAPRIVSDVLRSPGHSLGSATRSFFERRFGRDFSDVRVHTGTDAAESARAIQAQAYTAGSDIVFASGQYSPETPSGRSLLAHELTHVVQQDTVGPAEHGLANSIAPPISRNSVPIIRRNIFGDALDAIGDAAGWVGGKIEGAGEAAWEGAKWVGGKVEEGAEAVWDGTKWVAGRVKKAAVAVGEWAWDKMKNVWNCLVASGHATYNVLTMNVSSLADLLGVDEPTGEGPVFLKYLDLVLNHPCIQAIPGIGDAAKVLNKFISFLYTAWNIIQHPEPIFDAIRNALSKLIKAVVSEAEATVKRALDSLGAKLRKHGEGVWRHLEPKLQYLASNWWDVIKETAWNLLWPWPSVGKDLSAIWDNIKSAASNLSHLRFSKGIDDILAVQRGVLSIAGSLYGWFSIALILVGAIVGGGLPGAAAGAAIAAEVGEGLLVATVAVESASLVKAIYNLARGESDEDEEKDYEQISSSGLTLAITGVMFLLSELAVKFAQGLISRAAGLFRRRSPKSVAVEAPVKGGGAIDPKSASLASDFSPEQLEATNKSLTERIEDPTKLQEHPDLTTENKLDKTGEKATQASDTEPLADEIHEPLDNNGGDVRVTEEGHCKICHSPCRRVVQMAKEALNALWDSSARLYAENLAMRAQLLDDAIEASIKRGMFRAEYEPRFSRALKKLGNEVDGVHRRVVLEDPKAKAPALDEMEGFGSGRQEGIMDDPERHDYTRQVERAERAREGTEYHTKVEDAVVASLPPGTAFTENTIQEFLGEFAIDPKTLPPKSTGIDLYIIDHQRNLVTPVDITNVAGGRGHVAKLHSDVDKIRAAFERAGYHMSEPIEVEYAGQTFNQASKSIADELRPFAHP